MKLELAGKLLFEAPIDRVWAFLFDVEALTYCLPGVEEIKALDEKNYLGVMNQKLGPVSTRFEFTTSLTEVDLPKHLKAVGKGSDKGVVGPFSHEIRLDLRELSSHQVEVTYDVTVDLKTIPFFGKMILESRAKSLEKEFTTNLQQKFIKSQAKT